MNEIVLGSDILGAPQDIQHPIRLLPFEDSIDD
jgi:hypothetical protein